MNIQKQIKQLKSSGVRLTDIAIATGYSTAYVSKVYREHIDPAPKFRLAFKGFISGEEKPKPSLSPIEQENVELRTLVAELQNKLDEIQAIIGK